MVGYLEDQRMQPQLVGASQLLVVPTWIENHSCHISLSGFACICQLGALAYVWDGFKKHAAASGINCSDRNMSCGFGGYILLRR